MHLVYVKVAFLAVTTAFLGLPAAAYSQTSLNIAGIEISLGMDRKGVLAKLADQHLSCVPSQLPVERCDNLLVQRGRPPYDPLGSVHFADGKAGRIDRSWTRGFDGTDPAKFVQTLYSLLSSSTEQGDGTFNVSLSESRGPGTIFQHIHLTSGRKSISIFRIEGSLDPNGKPIPPSVDLHESIE